MQKHIWQNPKFPQFAFDEGTVGVLLQQIKYEQGLLKGKFSLLDTDACQNVVAETYVQDIIRSSEIEGVRLNLERVRSSVAHQLGLANFNKNSSGYDEESVVDVTMDAVQNYQGELTEERLFAWHCALFPTGRSGLHKIKVGQYRDDALGKMQIVSGPEGKEKIYYEAPPAEKISVFMWDLLNYVNTSPYDDLIKAALVHLWFVIIHPFEDGNGRIARAITDMLLARSENGGKGYYSISAQINQLRNEYYGQLEITAGESLDITKWMEWFLRVVLQAMQKSETTLDKSLWKAKFWQKMGSFVTNDRQRKVLNKMLDGFDGNLTTAKWAKICSCSQDTATRDIESLIKNGVLKREGQARATHYVMAD